MLQISKTLALSIALGTAAAPALAQGEGASSSAVTPKMLINAGCANGAVYSIASDAHGNVAAAGYCGDVNGAHTGFVAKADADGTVQWTYRPDSTMRPANLAFDTNGNVLVAGQTTTGAATVGAIIKIGLTGVPAWSRAVEAARGGNESCANVATDADDTVFVSCSSSPAASGSIVAYHADGTAAWRTDAFESAQALFTSSGTLYAASATNVRIVDRATGVVVSDARVSDAGSVRVGQDGKIYVKSDGGAMAVFDGALNAIGSVALNGALGAARSYDYFDVDARGNIYVLGAYYATTDLSGGGQYVAEFGPGGNPLWQYAADPAASFGPRQSPAALNKATGGSLVSVSAAGKSYVSTYLYLLEFPVR